jgi:hypothetical protein
MEVVMASSISVIRRLKMGRRYGVLIEAAISTPAALGGMDLKICGCPEGSEKTRDH